MNRPSLRQVPLAAILPIGSAHYRGLVITMARGQWDATLADFYSSGDVLLEIDDAGEPIAAYQRPGPTATGQAS